MVVFDALTYAGNRPYLADVEDRIEFVQGDIGDLVGVPATPGPPPIDTIVNFAAESHNSLAILDPGLFFRTNVLGTQTLAEAARRHGVSGSTTSPPARSTGTCPSTRTKCSPRSALPSPDPLQRLESRGRPRRARLRRDIRAAGHHHQLLQQLRSLPVPREGHPAVHGPGPRRPAPPSLRLDPEPAGVAARRRPLPGHRSGSRPRPRWGRPTTSAAGWRRASRRSPTPCSMPPDSRRR